MSDSQPQFDEVYDLLSSLRRAEEDVANEKVSDGDLVELALIKLVVHLGYKHCSVFLRQRHGVLACVAGTSLEVGLKDKPGAIRNVNRYGPKDLTVSNNDGPIGEAFKSAKPVVINEGSEELGTLLDFDDVRSPVAGSMVCLPLANRGHIYGVFAVSHEKTGFFNQEQLGILSLFADSIADSIGRLHKESELRHKIKEQKKALSRALSDANDLRDQVKQLTMKDPLTGMHNRGYFFDQGKIELSRARRHGTSLAIVMVDVDNLQQINERCGHVAGDKALQGVSTVLMEQARDGDIFVRFGGEDFMVMLPETDESGATLWADRIRASIMRLQISCKKYEQILTASFGVTGLQLDRDSEDYGDMIDHLCAQAATALQDARNQGGNQVCTYKA